MHKHAVNMSQWFKEEHMAELSQDGPRGQNKFNFLQGKQH